MKFHFPEILAVFVPDLKYAIAYYMKHEDEIKAIRKDKMEGRWMAGFR